MNINKYAIKINGKHNIKTRFPEIVDHYKELIEKSSNSVYLFECYPGTNEELLVNEIISKVGFDLIINSATFLMDEQETESILRFNITDDRVFGKMSLHNYEDFKNISFDDTISKIDISKMNGKKVAIYGTAASLYQDESVLSYVDISRWEIQTRYKNRKACNFNASNYGQDPLQMIKRGYFVDWPMADRNKKRVFEHAEYYLDLHDELVPKLVEMKAYNEALIQAVSQPFSVVPFYDPGIWGGSWMQEKFGVFKEKENLAWSFNGVPEENSIIFDFSGVKIESPANNVVFFQTNDLLGEQIESRFGKNFPIRFNFLDTMGGQNLSLQVHPKTDYIQDVFGAHYTQDESYYILEAKNDAKVYLGLTNGTTKKMLQEALEESSRGESVFNDKKYINNILMKKHDHFSIPAGTVHSSGADSVVLEISATPNSFTFKLWDWGRVDFDGLPRPVHLNHGLPNIDIYKDTDWVNSNLVNPFVVVDQGNGWVEEQTGLYRSEFLETRRHTFSRAVTHSSDDGVNVLNLVEGDEVTISSDSNQFEPFILTYAQTVIIPAKISSYTITPKNSDGIQYKTIKAFVRKY